MTSVLDITSALFSGLTLDEVLADFTEKMTGLLGIDSCIIFRWDREQNSLVLLAEHMLSSGSGSFEMPSQVGAVYPLASYPTTARVLEKETPVIFYIDDLNVERAERDLLKAFRWDGVLMVPMICRGQAIGLLKLAGNEDSPRRNFSGSAVKLCQALANQAAVAIENDRLYHEAEEGHLHAEAMQVIGRALASELDYERITRDVADFAYRLVDAPFVWVAVPEAGGFRRVAIAGSEVPNSSIIGSIHISPGLLIHNLLTRAVEEKRPVVVADIEDDPQLTPWQDEIRRWAWRSVVAVPLLSRNRLMGTLAAYAYEPNFFEANDIAVLMSLASQAATAIYNARLFAELEAQREELHQVSLRLVNAQEEERRRISRELHDELGQALTALKINLDVARRVLSAGQSSKLRHSVQEASTLAIKTLEAARDLSLELHPAMLDDLGLISALRWEIDRYEQRTGLTVHFKADLGDLTLRPEVEITIYRIITEALTNTARHAQASEVRVTLHLEDQELVISVEDNGLGFDAKAWFNEPGERESLGLVSMRERANLLDGRLEIISQPGQGTKIETRMPIDT